MSTAIIVSKSARADVEDYETSQARTESFGGSEGKAPKGGARLRPWELAELEYLWGSATIETGMRSVHGAIEDRLRRAMPRDGTRRRVLEELERHEGKAVEGAVVCVLLAEGGCTGHEVRRAIRMLLAHGKIERRALPAAVSSLPKERSKRDAPYPVHVKAEWSAHELVIVKGGRKAKRRAAKPETEGNDFAKALLDHIGADIESATEDDAAPPSEEPADHDSREARWRRQDEAIERECHMIECKDEPPTPGRSDHMISPMALAKIERAMRALSRIPELHRKVLKIVYGGGPCGPMDEEWRLVAEHTPAIQAVLQGRGNTEAVMRARMHDEIWLGRVKREAEGLIDEACREFRAARKATK